MVYEWQHQPLRSLYIALQLILTLFIRLPFWILISIFPPLRPRRSWTFLQSVLVKLIHYWGPLGYIPTTVGILSNYPDHVKIDPGAITSGVWVDPVPDLVTGEIKEIASNAGVEPIKIPGYWYNRVGVHLAPDAPAIPGEKVFYVMHGGGYAFCSASPTDWVSEVPRSLLRANLGIRRAFAIEYRLSVGAPYVPSSPFPAALLDALAGYAHLVRVLGFAPEDIIVEGDSAGGNLALALVRYLVEHRDDPALAAGKEGHKGRGLPAPPRALVLLSPWTDLTHSHYTPGSSALEFGASDVLLDLRTGAVEYARSAFLGTAVADTNRYVSPACRYPSCEEVSFRGFPRTYISAGAAERFRDQIRTLYERMVRDMGEEQVVYEEAVDAPHDYICSGHEPQGTMTLMNIAEWLEEL